MKDYNSFDIPHSYLDYFCKEKRSLFMYKYFNEYGYFPTQEQIESFTVPTEEIESFKQMVYAKYCENNEDFPNIPNNPDIETSGSTNTPSNNDYYEWFTMIYNVTTTTEPTQLFSGSDEVGTMVIDKNEITPTTEYTFDSIGTHKVKVLLKDTTKNSNFKFRNISQLKELHIPYSINSLGVGFLLNCGGIEKIFSYSKIAPSVSTYYGAGSIEQNCTFYRLNSNGVLCIPNKSDYSEWVRKSNNRHSLGNYNWTMEYF